MAKKGVRTAEVAKEGAVQKPAECAKEVKRATRCCEGGKVSTRKGGGEGDGYVQQRARTEEVRESGTTGGLGKGHERV